MKNNKLLEKMELISPEYVTEAAEERAAVRASRRGRRIWLRWGAAAACVCLLAAGAALALPGLLADSPSEPSVSVPPTSSTARITVGYDGAGMVASSSADLVELTEKEMFGDKEICIFRGTVSSLTNLTIDFNGIKEYRCVARVIISKVYRGDGLAAGDSIDMLLPCAVDLAGAASEDTGVISRLRCGMEGIFMPRQCTERSYMEMNGATLLYSDLAQCSLGDGERWAFLDTEDGLVYAQWAYVGARGAETLEDIEEYVSSMIR